MKRRDFNKSIMAFFAAPAVPFKALAAAPTAAATVTAVTPPNLYTWSQAIARTHGKCSAEMLKNMLHVDAAQASNLFSKLISNNVVGPANAFGLSQARSILPPATGIAETMTPTGPQDQAKNALDHVKTRLKADASAEDAECDGETSISTEDTQSDHADEIAQPPQT